MSRSTDLWVGATDDTPIPPRVRLRVWERDKGVCQCGCGIKIDNKPWDTDHTVAIINGGSNSEDNLRTLLRSHHREKTAKDVQEKSMVRRKKMKAIGLKPKGRPMPGSRASGIRKRMDGTVERR
jgi:5-methylcytosine-specific restriction protein A